MRRVRPARATSSLRCATRARAAGPARTTRATTRARGSRRIEVLSRPRLRPPARRPGSFSWSASLADSKREHSRYGKARPAQDQRVDGLAAHEAIEHGAEHARGNEL